MFSDLLIKIIVFLLPTQLGLHFWPSFSRVAGIKIDYLSPTLYLVDTLLITLVLFNYKIIISFLKKNILFVCLFLSFIIINTSFSLVPQNSLIWWLHLLLYLLFFITLKLRHLKWETIRTSLLCSTLLVVSLEIAQLIFQTSLNGPFYYLGERAYSGSTPGIGRFNLFGLEILRPMSTFSHSNSLAGFLLIVFYLFSFKSAKPWYKIIPFVGILLTFSKTAIVALAFIVFNLKPEIIISFSLALSLAQPLIQNYTSNWQSLSDRIFFLPYLRQIIINNPLTGTGLGNFIPALGNFLPGSFLTPSKLQPIHNLPYLIISELGFLGTFLIIISLLRQKVRQILSNPLVLTLLALVIFTGAFDHYIWTLPQNKLILLLALSIML
ncbi:MAG TPA: hypothetical protein VLH94_02610 [Spirochaetia bacterium]|nr:hypothetical protein [Spirochaetia bacterium]